MALSQKQIFSVVRKILSEQLGINPEDIRWDSNLTRLRVDMVKIEMEVEEELGLPAFDAKILRARTVRDVVNAFWRRPLTQAERALLAL